MRESVEKAMKRAKAHERAGQLAQAAEVYQTVLKTYPANRRAKDALGKLLAKHKVSGKGEPPQEVLRQVIALQQQGENAAAAARIEALLGQFPRSVMLWNVLGVAKLALDAPAEAAKAFRKVCELNPMAPEPPSNLGKALQALGRTDEAIAAYKRAIELKPSHVVAHNNLGSLLRGLDRYEEAAACYMNTLEVEPENEVAAENLGEILFEKDKHEEAARFFRKAAEINPQNAAAHLNLGKALVASMPPQDGSEHFRKAIEINPDHVPAHFNLGVELARMGEGEAARREFETVLGLKSDHAEAYKSLVHHKKYQTPDDPDVVAMQAIYDRGALSNKEMAHLCFALFKAWEDIGDPERAFGFLHEGNRRKREETDYTLAKDEELFAKLRASAEALDGLRASETASGPTPIFIVGMPRSGTTLTEQIISSHSLVSGGGELGYLKTQVRPAQSGEVPVTQEVVDEVRRGYLERLAAHAEGLPYVTDKLPHNFQSIPFIVAAFPEAPIIHLDRDPRAVCWSNYRQDFGAKGLEYCNDLKDTVAYYGLYDDLMAFWHERYPGRIYRLDYEALTTDQEGETRKLIAAAGLDWEDACLAFHKNRRSIKTASLVQVRKKLYTGSSEVWRRYEPFLDGAFDGFGKD